MERKVQRRGKESIGEGKGKYRKSKKKSTGNEEMKFHETGNL